MTMGWGSPGALLFLVDPNTAKGRGGGGDGRLALARTFLQF